MPPKNRQLLSGNIARELFSNMSELDSKQLDLFDDLFFALLEAKKKAAADAVRELKRNQKLVGEIHSALARGDVTKALQLAGMDKS